MHREQRREDPWGALVVGAAVLFLVFLVGVFYTYNADASALRVVGSRYSPGSDRLVDLSMFVLPVAAVVCAAALLRKVSVWLRALAFLAGMSVWAAAVHLGWYSATPAWPERLWMGGIGLAVVTALPYLLTLPRGQRGK